jgi:predicted transcriptional regulator
MPLEPSGATTKRVTIVFRQDDLDEVDRIAKKLERSRSWVVRKALQGTLGAIERGELIAS